jgi:hypothetical protein
VGITQAGGNSGDTISIFPTRRLGLRRYETFAGTTEGPRRVRRLDAAFLFGHERIVAYPDIDTRWGNFRIGGYPPAISKHEATNPG